MNDDIAVTLAKVGAEIGKVRQGCGLNLHELALLSGISAPALSLIETGKRDLRLSSLHRIAAALRVHPADLLRPPTKAAPAKSRSGVKGYDLSDYK